MDSGVFKRIDPVRDPLNIFTNYRNYDGLF